MTNTGAAISRDDYGFHLTLPGSPELIQDIEAGPRLAKAIIDHDNIRDLPLQPMEGVPRIFRANSAIIPIFQERLEAP